MGLFFGIWLRGHATTDRAYHPTYAFRRLLLLFKHAPFHGEYRGSIPLGRANEIRRLRYISSHSVPSLSHKRLWAYVSWQGLEYTDRDRRSGAGSLRPRLARSGGEMALRPPDMASLSDLARSYEGTPSYGGAEPPPASRHGNQVSEGVAVRHGLREGHRLSRLAAGNLENFPSRIAPQA